MSNNINPRITRRSFLATATAGLAAAGCSSVWAGSGAPVVETAYGRVKGQREGNVLTFKGIPYGASTEGVGRFRAPVSPTPWTGVKDCVNFGPVAPQLSSFDDLPPRPKDAPPIRSLSVIPAEPQSEDCLVLNVWSNSLSGKKPVMLWLHGGGYASGAASLPVYDGVNLADKQDVVMVSINHRLNILGYLYLDDISNGRYVDSASAGILDAVLALEWVRDNIANFGGDPDRVMIFGESGGGAKVSSLMGMVPARGLFHRAAMQSGSQLTLATPEEATATTLRVLKSLDVSPKNLSKLETIPLSQLLTAARGNNFRPVVGTPAFPSHPFDPVASSLSASVPLIVGDNRTETSVYMGNDPSLINIDEATLVEQLERVIPKGEVKSVIAMYRRLYPNANRDEIMYMATTDRGSFLKTTLVAERKAALEKAPAYMYGFYRHSPTDDGRWYSPHGAELPFVFDTLHYANTWDELTPETRLLADQMSTAWANFAKTGVPGGGIVPEWPSYNVEARPTMIFDTPPKGSRVENDPRSEQRQRMLQFGVQ